MPQKRETPVVSRGLHHLMSSRDARRRSSRRVEAAGIEPVTLSPGNLGVTNQCGAESGALGPSLDRELTMLVNAWPTLSAPIKAGILAILRAATS